MTHHGDIAEARRVVPGAAGPTLPELLAMQAATRGESLALLHKRHGIWQTWTWREAADEVARLAGALAAHDLRRGEAVLVAGASRPRLLLAFLACHHAGAVPVLVPQAGAGVAIETALFDHHPRVIFVAGEHEVHAIRAVMDRVEWPLTVVCDNDRGLKSLSASWLVTFDAFRDPAHGAIVSKAEPDAVAAIIYSAGTSGAPRAVELNHAVLTGNAAETVATLGLGATDRGFMPLPLGWGAALLLGPVQSLQAGFPLAFPESDDTVLRDLRDVGPSILFGPPLLFRRLRQAAFRRTLGAARPWRGLLLRALGFGSAATSGRGLLAQLVVASAREKLGLSRVRTAVCFGDSLPPQIAAFLTALGVTVRSLYDPAEAGFFACIGDASAFVPRSAHVRVGAGGRVQVRETRTAPWRETGDAASIDPAGRLLLHGPATGRTGGRDLAAVELRLRGSVYVRHACVVLRGNGDLAALLSVDLDSVAEWAQGSGERVRSTAELAESPAVRALLAKELAAINAANGPDQRITAFLIARDGFDSRRGEITADGKLRRAETERLHAQAIADLQAGEGIAVLEAAAARATTHQPRAARLPVVAVDHAAI